MAAKKIWVTWLPGDNNQKELHATIEALQVVGLEVNGAPWIDDLEKAVWTELVDMLSADDGPDLWLVCGRSQDFNDARMRYALSMVSANLLSQSPDTKVFLQNCEGQALPELPLLLNHWNALDTAPGWNAKVVAAAYGSGMASPELDFYFNVIAHSHIGQWLEVGPANGKESWKGAMFGIKDVDGNEIAFQAVGDRGQLPEKSTNEFPAMGIKAEVSGHEFVACALQNEISDGQSYYIKVKGFPSHIMFGANPNSDDAEVQVLALS